MIGAVAAITLVALTAGQVAIVTVSITAASAILVAVIQNLRNLRKENRSDHMENHALLLQIDDKMDKQRERLEDQIADLGRKVDRHIESHAKGGR